MTMTRSVFPGRLFQTNFFLFVQWFHSFADSDCIVCLSCVRAVEKSVSLNALLALHYFSPIISLPTVLFIFLGFFC